MWGVGSVGNPPSLMALSGDAAYTARIGYITILNSGTRVKLRDDFDTGFTVPRYCQSHQPNIRWVNE
jgi:hypothetical protein